MSRAKMLKGAATTGGVALAACAACCAPLIITPIVALFAAGGAGLALAGQLGLALLVVAAGAGYLWFRRHRRQTESTARSCAPTAGCNAGKAIG